MPHMSLGLIRGSCLLAAQHGVETVCAAMAPALLRLLERLGLFFEPLGPPIDSYHGLRQPCVAEGKKLLAGMAALDPITTRSCRRFQAYLPHNLASPRVLRYFSLIGSIPILRELVEPRQIGREHLLQAIGLAPSAPSAGPRRSARRCRSAALRRCSTTRSSEARRLLVLIGKFSGS